ncbi:hypothetical protein [Nocardioides sp.]|uniref:copper amine oxidase n=1 Tax=Nocardioides sp. TaxID=35761 RepID=UPI002626C96B|nr:hypothetical protein [Nocardioides sp.]
MRTMPKALVTILGIGLALAGLGATPVQAEPALGATVPLDTPLSCGAAQVNRTLSTGSSWRMCVRIDDLKGLVIENLQFRPATGDREYTGWMPILDSLALAQLNVPYDTGTVGFDDLTGGGLGGIQLIAQTPSTCPGTMVSFDQSFYVGSTYTQRTIPGACLATTSTGLAWHSQDYPGFEEGRYTEQGQALEISSLSKVGWYEYQQKVTLTDQGTITVGLGATGDIGQDALFFPTDPSLGWQVGARTGETSSTPVAASHWHNAIYRVDFGIDSGPQEVQRWDYQQASPSSNKLQGTPTTESRAFVAPTTPSRLTWWRVVNPTSLDPDGLPRSYEIVNDSVQDTLQPATSAPVSFTNAKPCEQYAWDNLDLSCPARNISEYVAQDTTPLTDPVAWVNVGFHHVVRNEDQSPMPTHWQEFALVPRDLLAQQATTPVERSCINGGPLSSGGSCAAVNQIAPVLTAPAGSLRPGSVLSVDNGQWKAPRSVLSFQQIWLRDGEPILAPGLTSLLSSVTGLTYTVTAADQGHRISVQVDASATGIVPGSARSNALAVPAATPPPSTPRTVRIRPQISATVVLRGTRATIRVRATGASGTVTGTVTVAGTRWKRPLPLAHGRATVTLRRALIKRTTTLTVRYSGSDGYEAQTRTFKVKKITRR